MSERPAEVEPKEPPKPKLSAVGMLLRPGAEGGWELLVGLRSRRSRFLPGHWACLGGALEAQDRPDEPRAYARCASREMAEETGIEVSSERLLSAGILVTPPFYPLRFHTEFFVALAPSGTTAPAAPPRPEEIEALRFVDPQSLLKEWERGEVALPPILPPQLRVLAGCGPEPLEQIADRLTEENRRQEQCHRIEFIPGIWMLPQASHTLPPASHTNTWMPGGRQFLVVDPGSADPEEIRRLLAVIERRGGEGQAPSAIFLTHHHRDHVEGVRSCAEKLGLPVIAHRETFARLPGLEGLDRQEAREGQLFDLEGMTLKAWHTPGHAPGHLALEVLDHNALVVGDLLSGFSTIVIDPEEGSMAEYMRSLRRVAGAGFRLLMPAHGPPLPGRAAKRLLAHREQREKKVLSGLGARPRSLEKIALGAYQDAPHAPMPLLRLQTRAILLELERKGLAVGRAKGWAQASE